MYMMNLCIIYIYVQDLLRQKWHVAVKDLIMALDCARWHQTYAQTGTPMHFGIHFIHRKKPTS